MNKEIFMRELAAGLAELGEQEQRQVADYYEELICDGMENGRSEEAIIEGFGSPAEVAAQIRAEYNVRVGAAAQAQTVRPVQTEYRAQGAVHTVYVEARNVRVNVRSVEGGAVRVLFQPREADKVTYTEENGVFRFSHNMDLFNVWSWLDILRGPHEITLELPADYAGELRVKTSNASVTAEGLAQLAVCGLETSNARVNVNRCTCAQLTVKSSNGSLTLTDLGGETCEASTGNARITAERCTFAQRLGLQTSNGTLYAQQIASDNVVLKTANAAITAALAGAASDYAVESHTSNASSNLPASYGGAEQTKTLRVGTSNGRIDVRFAQE